MAQHWNVQVNAGPELPAQSDEDGVLAHLLFYKTTSDAEGLRGLYAAREANGFAAMAPVGAAMLWFSDTPPMGWLLLDGSAVSRATYSDLFSLWGTTYGPGDGATTFNLPDLRQRVPVGRDPGVTAFDALGKTGGEVEHLLAEAEMPTHSHGYSHIVGSGTGVSRTGTNNGEASAITDPTGGGLPHNNMPPFLVVHYIVKA